MPPVSMRLVARAVVITLGLSIVTGCASASSETRTLTVFAASSLTEVFTEMGRTYRRSHPAVRFRFLYAGSPELLDRLGEREPADVLATADAVTMDGAASFVERPVGIARTAMTIAVAPGNPRRIRGLTDLARPGLRVVLAAPAVPAGRYARQIMRKAGVSVRPQSEETSARAVLDEVRTGQADAGIVYITDMRSARAAASSVPIPADQNVTATYFAAPVRDAGGADTARAFTAWLTSAQARALFARYGFAPAP